MRTLPLALDWLAYAASRLGVPGLLGLALLAAGGMLAQQGNALDREARVLAAHAAAREPAPTPKAAPARPSLPSAREAPAVLSGLFEAARHTGLLLDEGNYRVTTDHSAGLLRQQITLPVSGRYPALRAFLAEALNRHPSLALEALRLDRSEPGDGLLVANLRFVLYLREGS